MKLEICYRDKDLVVVVKPAGMPSQPDKTGDEDMCTALEKELGVSVYPVHRLDRPVGGLLVYALEKKAAAALSAAAAGSQMEKRYLAVVTGTLTEPEGQLRDFLNKNQRKNTAEVVEEKTPGAKEALLDYKVWEQIHTSENEALTLVEVHLLTGRHHQIRAQFAHRGNPLWGDQKYNPAFQRRKGVFPALWAYGLRFVHPRTKKSMTFESLPQGEAFSYFDRF